MVGKFEARKDTAQELTESLATRVGNIAGIVAGAVRDVTHELGEWATDVIEMREASRRAVAHDEFDRSADLDEGFDEGFDDDLRDRRRS